MTEVSQSKLDAVLRKVQGLMAHADDPANTPEAQETFRNKAEALMFQYRIEETTLASAQVGQQASGGVVPVWRTIFVSRSTNEYRRTYLYMAANAVHHVDGKFESDWAKNPADEGRVWLVLHAVGYESDLRYAELLFTVMQMGFAGKMEPRVDPAKTDAENAYVLRSAGMEGRRIAALLWGDDSKPNRVKARKLFAQHAAALGEDPSVLLGRGNNVNVFRESYADAFENEMSQRLYLMRISHGDSGEMVLASRKTNVAEAFYTRYPHKRPGRPAAPGRSIGGRDTCQKCQAAKSGYCREHAHLKPSTARYVERAYSHAGAARGRQAARSVDLSGTASKGRLS